MTRKALGIIRRVDELGRVCIPIEMRHALGVDDRGLEFFTQVEPDGEQVIIMRPYRAGCSICGDMDVFWQKANIRLCKNCTPQAEAE